MTDDGRYPYTYAADLIRTKAGYHEDGSGIKLSRSDASKIRQLFAKILDIPDEELAKKLADYYLNRVGNATNHTIYEASLETLKVSLDGKNLLKKNPLDERPKEKTFTKPICTCGGKCH